MDQTVPAAPTSTATERRFLGHLHAFRALTIVLIVAVHVGAILRFFNVAEGPAATGLGMRIAAFVVEAAVHNATIFFALISGLLYAQVLAPRGWRRFFVSKARNVALPYLVVSALFALFPLQIITGGYVGVFRGTPADYLDRYFSDVFHQAVQSNPVLWYIPVLLMMFALTPLLVAILRTRLAPLAMAGLLVLPLVFSRVWPQFSWNNLAFFIAPFAAGLYFGEPGRYERLLAFTRRTAWAWLALLAASCVAIWFVLAADDQPLRFHGTIVFESVTYLQKMLAAPLLLVALHRFDAGVPRFVSRIADDSFAIYFLHIWAVTGWLWLIDKTVGTITSPLLYALLVVLGTMLIIALLVVVIGLLRRLFGRWSRPLIGA